jgi:hypothetical protein
VASYIRRWLLLLILTTGCSCLLAQTATAPSVLDATVWGDAANGLQMAIFQDQGFQGTNRETHLTVEFRNVGQGDETFMTAGGACGRDASAAVLLNLTDAQGTQHRHLPYFGDGPPYGDDCPDTMGSPKVVTLHPGASVSMPLFLGKYLDLSDSKAYVLHRFPAGTYSLKAELSNPASPRFNSGRWNGTAFSNVLQIHFDSEFGSVFGNCKAYGLYCTP